MARTSIYEYAGGAPAFLDLAADFHARCLADPVLEHPFSHTGNPDHVRRLAEYWGEVLGGPPVYSGHGGHSAMLLLHANQAYSTAVNVPFLKQFHPDLLIEPLTNNFWTYPLAFIPFYTFIVFIMVGSSNAVNLTDGLDGLAIGCTFIAAGALTVFTYLSGHATFAAYLGLPHEPQVGELTIFCGAMVGASLGFLWFNAPPASVFMGDTGSLAIGAALGTLSIITKHELVLAVIGGLFVLEAVSVILQVASFKTTGRRIFRMAPLHHHFEQLGWEESKIVIRFWIIAIILAIAGLATLKLR